MLDSLYENIGGKIKNWAKWIFIVEAIGAVIAGLALAVNEDALYIFIAIIGPIIAWVGSWILYAFGELVEDTHAMRKKMCCQEDEKAKQDTKERESLSALVFFCPKCNQTFIGKNCDISDMPECPDCNSKTYSTRIKKEEWIKMTKEDRKIILQKIAKQ